MSNRPTPPSARDQIHRKVKTPESRQYSAVRYRRWRINLRHLFGGGRDRGDG